MAASPNCHPDVLNVSSLFIKLKVETEDTMATGIVLKCGSFFYKFPKTFVMHKGLLSLFCLQVVMEIYF